MLLVALLFITSLQYRKESAANWFGKQVCTSLKGIAAIYIVLVHIHVFTPFSSPWVWALYPINSIVIFANGLFFFISGWGLWESKRTKTDYLRLSSLANRLLKLLVPVYLMYIMYYFIRILNQDAPIPFVYYLLGRGGVEYLYFNDVLWFIIELCFLYVLFWFLYGKISKEKSNVIFIILIALWIAWAVYSGRGIVWYASTYCFFFGILLSQYKGRVQYKIERRFRFYMCGSVIGCIVSFLVYLITLENKGIINAIFANCSTILFCVVCFLILYKFEVKSTLTLWLGRISYELYLCHMIIIKEYKEIVHNDVWRIYCTIFSAILVAVVVHWIDCSMVYLFAQRSEKI